MANKVTTLGYFMKRMRDSGYRVERVFDAYNSVDPRAWTVLIDPGVASLFCTCYINRASMDDNYFELYDGGQFIPGRFILKTSSIEVLVGYLAKYGINNKASGYIKPHMPQVQPATPDK